MAAFTTIRKASEVKNGLETAFTKLNTDKSPYSVKKFFKNSFAFTENNDHTYTMDTEHHRVQINHYGEVLILMKKNYNDHDGRILNLSPHVTNYNEKASEIISLCHGVQLPNPLHTLAYYERKKDSTNKDIMQEFFDKSSLNDDHKSKISQVANGINHINDPRLYVTSIHTVNKDSYDLTVIMTTVGSIAHNSATGDFSYYLPSEEKGNNQGWIFLDDKNFIDGERKHQVSRIIDFIEHVADATHELMTVRFNRLPDADEILHAMNMLIMISNNSEPLIQSLDYKGASIQLHTGERLSLIYSLDKKKSYNGYFVDKVQATLDFDIDESITWSINSSGDIDADLIRIIEDMRDAVDLAIRSRKNDEDYIKTIISSHDHVINAIGYDYRWLLK